MKKMKKAIICILSLALCSALFSPLLPRMVSAAESEAPSITVAGSVPDETTPDESTQEPESNTPNAQSSEPDERPDNF